MSIKELLKLDADGLDKFSDAQLREYFSPYLKMIKPLEQPPTKKSPSGQRAIGREEKFDASKVLENAKRLAKQFGIEI